MTIKDRALRRLNRKTVNSGIRICVECGSILTSVNKKKIKCTQCGSSIKFKHEIFKPKFKAGTSVRIIDSENDSNQIYKIKKVKKSHDGTILYLLKSNSKGITLLYNESEKSHLEKDVKQESN